MIEGPHSRSMTYVVHLRFHGQLDATAMESAIVNCVRFHPLLSSMIHSGDDPGEYYWVAVPEPHPFISIDDLTCKFEFPVVEPIDLQTEIGLRVWIRHGNDLVDMRFQFHHACCDGLGAFQMIEDVLSHYDCTVRQNPVVHQSLPMDEHAHQLRFSRPQHRLGLANRVIRSTVVLPIRIVKLFAQRPDPIHSKPLLDCQASSSTTLPNPLFHEFSREESQSLCQIPRQLGATVNDFLLCNYLLAIDHWNEIHGSSSSKNLRLLVPFSLRPVALEKTPVVNCVSMVYVAANRRLLKKPRQLLASISKQRKFIRRWQIEYSWNQTAALVASSKVVIRLLKNRAQRRLATSVFSNLGELFRHTSLPFVNGEISCGRLILKSVLTTPPANASAGVTFTCSTYAEKLAITMNFHRPEFRESDAVRFLNLFVNRLQTVSNADWT